VEGRDDEKKSVMLVLFSMYLMHLSLFLPICLVFVYIFILTRSCWWRVGMIKNNYLELLINFTISYAGFVFNVLAFVSKSRAGIIHHQTRLCWLLLLQ
jgi:hypothetical protein